MHGISVLALLQLVVLERLWLVLTLVREASHYFDIPRPVADRATERDAARDQHHELDGWTVDLRLCAPGVRIGGSFTA
jgi:hypothetical protein